jgi:membrane protease subunit HflK
MTTGFNIKLPWPIETVDEVDTKSLLQLTIHSEEKDEEGNQKHDLEMLTKDMSKLKFEEVVQYNIQSPEKWLFNTQNPQKVLEYISLSITRQVVAKYDFQESYSTKREEIGQEIKEKLQLQLDNLDSKNTSLGVRVDSVKVINPAPPAILKTEFEEVAQADSQRQTKITSAQGEAAKINNDAKGEASKITNQAIGEKATKINDAKAEVAVYLSLLEQYKAMPNVTKNEYERQITENSLWGVKRTIDKRSGTLFRNQ